MLSRTKMQAHVHERPSSTTVIYSKGEKCFQSQCGLVIPVQKKTRDKARAWKLAAGDPPVRLGITRGGSSGTLAQWTSGPG